MGSIIAVVAVLEIHMERNALATINPKRTPFVLLARFPRVKIQRVIRRSMPDF